MSWTSQTWQHGKPALITSKGPSLLAVLGTTAQLKSSFIKWVEEYQDMVDPDTSTFLFTQETHKLVKATLTHGG